jgi:RimJ/RimL family protein N-acetyltransferase
MPVPDLAGLVWPRRTARLVLRPATLDDVDAIHSYRGLPEVVRHLSHDVLTRDEVAARVADRIERASIDVPRPCLGLVVEEPESGEVVGDAMVSVRASESISRSETDEWEGVIGYAFDPRVHGRGFATEAARELLVIGFDALGLRRICADAFTENVPSNRVLAKIGMRLEATLCEKALGKDGRWLDDNRWAILRHEWDHPGR